MAKEKTVYVCSHCGQESSKWIGKCPSCGQWNTFKEFVVKPETGGASANSGFRKLFQEETERVVPIPVGQIASIEEPRIDMQDAELNRVLGGGLVPGSLVLLGGEPGIGKSTLVLQTVLKLKHRRILYVSGEESARQLKLRADRLVGAGQEGKESDEVWKDSLCMVVCETSLEQIFVHVKNVKPELVVIDSIQTIMTETVDSSPGSISQVRECAASLLKFAKGTGIPVILIGHINKEGTLAGPKVLEHIVDTVLYFEGDNHGAYRILRTVKNRFGSTSEMAIFSMGETGLSEVLNPSAALLAERHDSDGSVILATIEGSRPLLVEIQALVNPTNFGYPKRTASGFDLNRLNLLIAVLERRTKLRLQEKDVFINVVGGLRLNDSAADLAICMAIASAAASRRLDPKLVVFGEVGLGGEIRSVTAPDRRLAEAKKLGFTAALAPATIQDDFVRPVKDLRSALIEYMRK